MMLTGLLSEAHSVCCHTIQDHLLRGSISYRELSPPTSTINQENPSGGLPPGQCDGGPSSQMTVAGVKLTKSNNQRPVWPRFHLSVGCQPYTTIPSHSRDVF